MLVNHKKQIEEKGISLLALVLSIVIVIIAIETIVVIALKNKDSNKVSQGGSTLSNDDSSTKDTIDLSKYHLIGGNEKAEELAKAFGGNIELVGDGTAYGDGTYDYNIRNINIKTNEFLGKGAPISIQTQNITRSDELEGNIKELNAKIEAYFDVGYGGSVEASGAIIDPSNVNPKYNMVHIFAKIDEDFTGFAVVNFLENGEKKSKSFSVNAKNGDIEIWDIVGKSEISFNDINIYFIENTSEADISENISLPIDEIYFRRLSNYKDFYIEGDFTDFSLKHNTKVFSKKNSSGYYKNVDDIYVNCIAIVEMDGQFYASKESKKMYKEANNTDSIERLKDFNIDCGDLIGEPQKIKSLYLYKD